MDEIKGGEKIHTETNAKGSAKIEVFSRISHDEKGLTTKEEEK